MGILIDLLSIKELTNCCDFWLNVLSEEVIDSCEIFAGVQLYSGVDLSSWLGGHRRGSRGLDGSPPAGSSGRAI